MRQVLEALAPVDPLFGRDRSIDFGLLGDWRFDRDAGLVLLDRSRFGRQLVVPSPDEWEATRFGLAYHFDADADGIDLASLPIPHVDAAGTIEIVTIPNVNNAAHTFIFSGRGAGNTRNFQWNDYPNYPDFRIGIGALATVDSGLDWVNGELNHSVHAWNAGSYWMWLNGVAGNTGSYSYDSGGYATAIYLGRYYLTGAPWLGRGLLFRVYDRVLSDEEVARRYEITLEEFPTRRPVWYIPFVVISAGETPISVADVGAGSEALSIEVQIPVADTGAGSEIPAVEAQIPVAETGTGSAVILIQAQVSTTDAGQGAQSVDVAEFVPVSVADAGTGAESIGIDVQVSVAETGAGAGVATIEASLSVLDSGVGLEVVAVQLYRSVADVAGGAGAVAVGAPGNVQITDVGAGAVTLTIYAPHPDRTLIVAAEVRVFTVPAEDRTFTVGPEDRTFKA